MIGNSKMKNKYVVELVVESEEDLTKKRIKEILLEALSSDLIDEIIKYRIRSVDKD